MREGRVSERGVGDNLLVNSRVETEPQVARYVVEGQYALALRPLHAPRSETCVDAKAGLSYYRFQRLVLRERMGRHGLPRLHGLSCERVREMAKAARRHAHEARQALYRWREEQHSDSRRFYAKWKCIHQHEGAWNANTGNGYYGGLQMTYAFQQAHGPQFLRRWGTADRWPPWAQIEAAEDAWRDEGIAPSLYKRLAERRA